MSDPQLADVARVCNRYPDIEVNFDVVGGETVTAGESVQINVFMERTLPEGQDLAPVHCPRCVQACSFTVFLNCETHFDSQLLCCALCLAIPQLGSRNVGCDVPVSSGMAWLLSMCHITTG